MAGPDDQQDRLLMQQVADGDMAAMKALYMRHAPVIRSFVTNYVKNQFDVADVLQTTMLEVWRTAGKFEGRAGVRTWILSVAKFKAIDHIRKQSRVTPVEPTSPALEEIDNDSAEAIVGAAQDAENVRACVEALPDQQRAAIQLAFFQDMTYGEVAEAEGVAEGTVKTRIFHAKKLLLRCLEKKGHKK